MLEAMRRNSRNAIIYVLFGIIIAVFVINFGPGSRGCAGNVVTNVAAKVGGATITEHDFRFAYIALGGTQVPGQMAKERRLKEFVMDKLIERELLAEEATRLGFSVSTKEVEDMIADGRMMVMGVPRRVDSYVYKDGKFDYDRFKMVSQNQLGVSVVRFIEIERRELLADKAREVLKVSTKSSPEEVKDDFIDRGTQVNLEYARFSTRRYEDTTEASPAEIDAYVKAHEVDLKKQFEERAFLYKKLEKQLRLRHVLIEVAKDASPATALAAKKKIEEAAVKLKSGTTFVDVAREFSSENRTKQKGGLLPGWRKKGFTGFGEAIDEKLFAAKRGDSVGPEKTDRGFELVFVEDIREGDVPVIIAEREIAESELLKQKAKSAAKAEAQAVLDRVQKGEKLERILPKSDSPEDAESGQVKGLKQPNESPKISETGLFSRRGEMVQDIGVSKELARRAFEMKPGEISGPFEVSGSWVIVRVKEHKDADLADFEKRKDELMRQATREKWASIVDSWSKQRCSEVRDQGGIHVNDEMLSYDGVLPTRGNERSKYVPCASGRPF
jgi:peptidyl-prolyl cis-trans isomerase D